MTKRLRVRAPRCPNCPYAFIAPAKFRWYELPLVLLMRRPYRCQTCQERYLGRVFPMNVLINWLRNRAL